MKISTAVKGLALILLTNNPPINSIVPETKYSFTKPAYAQEQVVRNNQSEVKDGILYHTVQKGESYESIANMYWNSPQESIRIRNLNPGVHPLTLKTGQKIRVKIIQTLEQIQRGEKRKAIVYHTIQKGENYETIADLYFITPQETTRLKRLNPDVNPNNLKVGQKIRVMVTDDRDMRILIRER